MSRQEPRPITEGALEAATWAPNRKRPCPFLVVEAAQAIPTPDCPHGDLLCGVCERQEDGGVGVATHIRDLVDLPPATLVLWPQAGYTTVAEVWATTAGAIVERARSKGLKA